MCHYEHHQNFTFLQIVLLTVLPAIIAAVASWYASRIANRRLLREFQLDFVVERTIRKYLQNPRWRIRTFAIIKRRLHGIDENQLRIHLIQAGAVAFFKGEEELWGLVERNPEDTDQP